MAIRLIETLREPVIVAEGLTAQQPLWTVVNRLGRADVAVFDAVLVPPVEFAVEGYPSERARVTVRAGGEILAFPVASRGRSWVHRNPLPMCDLCLWYPEDDRALRWEWADGLEMYLSVVHRHLVFEEFARRHGCWPVEDAPHGAGPHPVVSAHTRAQARRWARFRAAAA